MKKTIYIFLIICFAFLICMTLVACGESSTQQLEISEYGESFATNKFLNLDDIPAEIRYIISFSTGTIEEIEDRELSVLSRAQAPQPDNRYKVGYRFEGWYLNQDFSGAAISYPYTFMRNTTLYAKWVINTTVNIENVEQLIDINSNLGGNYILKRNLDLAEYGIWTPIGDRIDAFSGVFDGNGYTISNMLIQDLEEDDEEFHELPIGLFARVTGQVKNVTLVDFKITLEGEKSRFMLGGIIGHLDGGSLLNSQAKGEVINSEMTYRKKFVDTFWVTAKPSTLVSMGVAVGKVEAGEVRSCSSEGRVVSYSNATKMYTDENDNKFVGAVYSGGLIGYLASGRVEYSSSTTDVYGKCAGGLVGYNNGVIYRCHASGFIEGSLSYPSVTGGLAAYNNTLGIVNESYSLGNTKGRTAGGLIGVNKFDYTVATGGLIYNCFAKGDVYASEYAGGLIGRAVSDIPYLGWEEYSILIFNPAQDNDRAGIDFKAIHHCFAYGDVIANASETTFEDEDGNEVRIIGVYYPVFAGGMVGQANEMLLGNCIAFGNVEGISHRIREEGGEINARNPAYTNNFVGHSTSLSSTMQQVYCIEDQVVTSNGIVYFDFNSVATVQFGDIQEGLFLKATMGFDDRIWRLSGLNIIAGDYPSLLG